MELDESTQDKLYELLYESDSDSSSSDKSENSSGYISDNNIEITNNCANCPDGNCTCGHDEFYRLQSQIGDSYIDKLLLNFEDLHFKMISSENLIELLKDVSDENLRNKILNMASSKPSSSSNFEKPKKEEKSFENFNTSPYSIQEVFTRLEKKRPSGSYRALNYF